MSKQTEAKQMYNTMCKTLTNRDWHYQDIPTDDGYVIKTGAVGDDLSMPLLINIMEGRGIMYLRSPMTFKIPENRRDLVGRAIHYANDSIINGVFEYDEDDGSITFKIIVPYMGSIISEETCEYMLMLSCITIDKFNDKFLALANGIISLADFKQIAYGD